MTQIQSNQNVIRQKQILDLIQRIVEDDDWPDWVTTTDMYEYLDHRVPRSSFTRKMRKVRGSWDCIEHRVNNDGGFGYEYTYTGE